MAALADAGEAIHYLIRFWGAVFRPSYRTQLAGAWERAGIGSKSWMVLEGTIATIVGLGVPALIIWLIYSSVR